MEPRADVALGDSEHAGDLAVGQPAGELERDEVAVAGIERGERGAHLLTAEGALRFLVRAGGPDVHRLALERRAPFVAAQFVERGIAGDPEDPGLRRSAPSGEAAPLAVGAL